MADGAEELIQLGKALKELGDKQIRREALKSIRESVKPMTVLAKNAAAEKLPRRGGLGADIAKTKVTSRTRLTGNEAGVRLVGMRKKDGGTVDLDRMDAGRLRHPVFGNRKKWVTQEIRPGWWTETLTDAAPEAMKRLQAAIGDALKRTTKT